MELTIIFEPPLDGACWIASIAEYPGAFSQGRTKVEARAGALDALAELMFAHRELALRRRSKLAGIETGKRI